MEHAHVKGWVMALLVAAWCGSSWAKPPSPQPSSGGGLPLSLDIHNPSRAEAALFRVISPRKKEPHGIIHPGSSMRVEALPGQKWVVYFQCRQAGATFTVPRTVSAQWKLPARPCR